jgi:hypothetical protein
MPMPRPGRAIAAAAALIAVLICLFAAPARAAEDGLWLGLTDVQRAAVLQTLADELADVQAGIADIIEQEETRKKTLEQILAELGQEKSALEKYAGMALAGLRKDAAKFAAMAGEASAGNYQRLLEAAPGWGAALFADMVAGKLKGDSKVVWLALVARAGSLQEVGIAFMRGDWHQAFEKLKAQARKEGEQISKDVIARIIDWVFSDSPVELGGVYVSLIESEIAFLNWSRRVIGRRVSGPCLDRYVEQYRRTAGSGGSHESAVETGYDEFEQCAIVNAYGFFEIEAYIVQAGLDSRAVWGEMLEGYRTQYLSPDEWLERRLAAEKAQVEQQINTELATAQAELDAAGRQFVTAMGARLQALIDEKVSDEERKRLEALARKALADLAGELKMLLDARDGVTAACSEFDSAKQMAVGAWKQVEESLDAVVILGRKLDTFPQCQPTPEEAERLQQSFHRSFALSREIGNRVAATDGDTRLACAAREEIAAATSKAEAKALLDATTFSAGNAQEAVDAGKQSLAELEEIASSVEALQHAAALRAEEIAGELAALDSLLIEFEQSDPDAAAEAFARAKARMQRAQQQAANLAGFADEKAKLIREGLEPHRGGPLALEVKKVLDEAAEALQVARLCSSGIVRAWTSGEDGEPSWSSRDGDVLPSVEAARRSVADAKERCSPEATGADVAARTAQEIRLLLEEARADDVLLDLARQSYERCLAEAIVAYNDAWLTQPDTPVEPPGDGSAERDYKLVKTKITRNLLGQAPQESVVDGFQGALDVRSTGPGFEFVVTLSAEVPQVVNELGDRFTASARARSQFSLGGVTSNINTAVSVAGQGVHEALPKPDQPWLQPGNYALEANHSVNMNLGDWTRTYVENGVEHLEFTVNFHGGVVQSISGGSLTFVYRREESGDAATGTAVAPGAPSSGGMQHIVLQGLGQTANLRRTGWDSWTWAEDSAAFNFRVVSNTPLELVIVDASRDMYHRLNLVTGETWWRQGQSGNWNVHYRIVAVDGAVR